MTDSTEASAKSKKAPGPIRTGVVIPLAVIVAVVLVYFKLFFDLHLKNLIEWTATTINGAEVDVAKVETSFLKGSFLMLGLEVTDKNQPERNTITVGHIHFQFLWDALLRAKFVVNDAAIEDIQALVPRRTPGRVVPPPPAKDGGPGALQKVQDSVLTQTKAQYNDNLLGDLASVLGGVDPNAQLKNIESELKSSGRIKELEKELKEKEIAWRERLKKMPQGKEIQDLANQLKGLKFDTKNPIEFANSVKQADKVLKEIDKRVKEASATGQALNQDLNTYSTALKEVEKMVDEDIKDLQARLKIPNVNASDFTKALFMRMLGERVAGLRKYLAVAMQYMPPKKTKEQKAQAKAEEIVPRRRGDGRNYRFRITTGYPLFWLQRAKISSAVSSDAGYTGNISGELKDFTSDPQYLKKPAIVKIKGDFPKQDIHGVDLLATLDHTTETPKDSIVLKIGSYPVDRQVLSDSPSVQFAIAKAIGGLDLNGEMVGDQADIKIVNAFTKVDYSIDASNTLIKEILTKTMAGIPVIDLKARVQGTWDRLDFNLSSNLGDELSSGVKTQVQAKIDDAKAKLKNMINEKIGGDKQKLLSQFDQVKSSVTGEAAKSEAEVNNAKKSAEADANKQKKKSGNKLEEEGKKLLKKFNLGG